VFSDVNQRRVESIEDQIALVNRGRRGRTQIQAKPLDLEFEPPYFPKTDKQRKFLRKVLKSNFLFNGLNDTETELLMSAMQEEHVEKGDLVIVQGDIGDFFYIVEKGKIEYLLDDKSVGFAQVGDGFGELALLYDAPRAVTCQAVEESSLWKVDQRTFRTVLARQTTNRDNEVKDLIDNVKLFEHLEPYDKARFVNAMTTVVWKPKDRIVQKGSVGNVFYIIQEGEVKIHDIGKENEFEDTVRRKGDFFGERALLTGELRAANVTALTEVKTLAMDRETFEKVVGPLQMLLDMEMRKQFLKAIPLFKKSDLSDPELDQIARLMKEAQYQQGQMLATAGQTHDLKLWIVRHGSLAVSNTLDQEIHHLESGDYFGDKFFAGDADAVGTTNAFVQEPLTTWVVSREDVENVIGDIGRLNKAGAATVSKQVEVSIGKMQRLTILGKGAYGTVWLVKHNSDAFALKEMSKRQLVDGNQANGVKREKEMLESMHHPFILGMVACFQDKAKVYFVLPIVPGGELFSVLHNQKVRNGGLKNYNAAFYAAGILEALGYFHQRLIAYRDLKLENVLIDADGYPVVSVRSELQ
jgi:cAMP-dependent protein kinase regulator